MPPRNLAPAQSCPGAAGIRFSPGEHAPSINCRSPRSGPVQGTGRITPAAIADHHRLMAAITTSSSWVRSARSASRATTACNRTSNTEAIGPTLASTAIRSIRRIRSIEDGKARGKGEPPPPSARQEKVVSVADRLSEFLKRLRWWVPATARWIPELIGFFAPYVAPVLLFFCSASWLTCSGRVTRNKRYESKRYGG